ncbi:23S rRNA (adenine(2030)-N(6))-methyltransferase RlmJ [Lysobacteraceae bacterium NML08-0793]|nr:23S rRNA (adenine(2030)-N(6))-methyltransferase RlmJ [Xanthomonadaceae bacterium NML08-0793]
MNYRHGFHAGNHADVIKHIALLALCDALTAKPAACFALDTHAGRGLYWLDADEARRTGEAEGGIACLVSGKDALIDHYLAAVAACRAQHGETAYPGSPWLLAHALRAQDRIAACELQTDEATALRQHFAAEPRLHVHHRDGYAAMKALLPPRDGATRLNRGLVLIDPPYEAQLAEFDTALAAIGDALERWPQGIYALWYPIKQGRALAAFMRRAAALSAKSALVCELLVRPDVSPLRMNGSGMMIWNAPWQLDLRLQPAFAALAQTLGENGQGRSRAEWLKQS